MRGDVLAWHNAHALRQRFRTQNVCHSHEALAPGFGRLVPDPYQITGIQEFYMQTWVAVGADRKTIEDKPFHAVGEKYLTAVSEVSGCVPIIVPALEAAIDVRDLIARIDGLMLTGSLSNVHPARYGRDATAVAEPYDEHRDGVSFALIGAALERGVPILAVCRGFQELNVAMGGTLHPRLHELEGRDDHRAPGSDDPDIEYGPRHEVAFIEDGAFARLAGSRSVSVNSLHSQGIDRLGEGLVAEGFAPDGTIEAVRVAGAKRFALAVQWHPEYKAAANDFSVRLYRAFGAAVRDYASNR